MLRLALSYAVVAGYIVAGLFHATDILDIPLPFIGVVWWVAVRFSPRAVPHIALFWVTYTLLVYQLVSFHDLNGCLLSECKTEKIYSYIALASTALFWFIMEETPKNKPEKTPKKLPILKIKPKKEKPFRLNMGSSLQAKWV